MIRLGRSLVSGLTRTGVQVAVLDATKAANEAVIRHGISSPVHASALAQGMNGAILLNVNMKGEERLELMMLANDESAPVQQVHAQSISAGEVRGHVHPTGSSGGGPGVGKHSSYSGPVDGLGDEPILHVSKVLYNRAEKVQSYVRIPGGCIELGIRHFFEQSEQIDTVVQMHVDHAPAGTVPGPAALAPVAAQEFDGRQQQQQQPQQGHDLALFSRSGLVFAQRLPGVADGDWEQIVQTLSAPPDIHGQVIEAAIAATVDSPAGGNHLQESLQRHLRGIEFDDSAWKRKAVDFFCRCNREQFAAGVRSMDEASRRQLFEDTGSSGDATETIEVTCHHCNSRYTFRREDVL